MGGGACAPPPGEASSAYPSLPPQLRQQTRAIEPLGLPSRHTQQKRNSFRTSPLQRRLRHKSPNSLRSYNRLLPRKKPIAQKKRPIKIRSLYKSSDSGAVRTLDPQLRRLLLYPTELRNHRSYNAHRASTPVAKIEKVFHFTQHLQEIPASIFPNAIIYFKCTGVVCSGQSGISDRGPTRINRTVFCRNCGSRSRAGRSLAPRRPAHSCSRHSAGCAPIP